MFPTLKIFLQWLVNNYEIFTWGIWNYLQQQIILGEWIQDRYNAFCIIKINFQHSRNNANAHFLKTEFYLYNQRARGTLLSFNSSTCPLCVLSFIFKNFKPDGRLVNYLWWRWATLIKTTKLANYGWCLSWIKQEFY